MRTRVLLTAAVAVTAGALAGCSAAGVEGARATAQAFYAALERSDEQAACELLAPDTLAELEEAAGRRCARALAEEDLEPSGVRRVQVYGHAAFVELARDTAFLARFPDGWRVNAAGCTERRDRPYDCKIEAG